MSADEPPPSHPQTGDTAAHGTGRAQLGRRLPKVTARHVALIAAVVTALGGLPLAFQSYNQLIVLPASLPVTLALDMTLTPTNGSVARDGLPDLVGLQAEIDATNFGDRNVIILAAWYELRGFKLDNALVDPKTIVDDALAQCGPRMRGRYAFEAGDSKLIETGHFLDGWSFEPGEHAKTRRLLLVRPGDFDFLRLTSFVYLAKGNTLKAQTDPQIQWETNALARDSAGYCRYDYTGDPNTAVPPFEAAWTARDPGWLPWDRGSEALAVQWRSSTLVTALPDGTIGCEAQEPACVTRILVGGEGRDAWASPYLGVCQADGASLSSCRSVDELPSDKYGPVADKFGLTLTDATLDYPLWAGPSSPSN